MDVPTTDKPTRTAEQSALSDRSGVNDAVRIQILTAEHSSLLLTRSITSLGETSYFGFPSTIIRLFRQSLL